MSTPALRPAGLLASSAFFGFGSVVAFVTAAALAMPHGRLESIWRLNGALIAYLLSRNVRVLFGHYLLITAWRNRAPTRVAPNYRRASHPRNGGMQRDEPDRPAR